MKFLHYLQERAPGEFGSGLLPKYSNYAPGVTPQKRLRQEPKTKEGKIWHNLTNEILTVREQALNNKKTNKPYAKLLEKLYMKKDTPENIRKEFLKIKKGME